MRTGISQKEWIVTTALVLLTTVLFGTLVAQMIYNMSSDYRTHINFAANLLNNHVVSHVHLLFQALLISITAIFPIPLQAAAWFVSVAFYVFAALILYRWVRQTQKRSTFLNFIISAGIALSLLLVAPVNIISLQDRHFYYGYIFTNALHNPTIVLLKPFALLLFALTAKIITHGVPFTLRTVFICVLLILLSLFTKPNYVLSLLPALLLVAAYRLYRHNYADMKLLILGLIIPMILALGVQYLIQYLLINRSGAGIIFAPLVTLALYGQAFPEIVIKFLLSILFPLVVYILHWRNATKDVYLNLAWITFLIGAAQMYLLAESGDRIDDGNFWWSGQITLFVLFVYSTLFVLKQSKRHPTWRRRVGLYVYILHFVSGLIFFFLQFRTNYMGVWW